MMPSTIDSTAAQLQNGSLISHPPGIELGPAPTPETSELVLDLDLAELRSKGHPLALQPLPFRLFAYLARNQRRVVPRAELVRAIWPDTHIGDGALTSAIRDLRRALGDNGKRQHIVRTLRGRGLRLVATVEIVGEAATEEYGQPPDGSLLIRCLASKPEPVLGLAVRWIHLLAERAPTPLADDLLRLAADLATGSFEPPVAESRLAELLECHDPLARTPIRVEGLQWADPESLQLIRAAVERMRTRAD